MPSPTGQWAAIATASALDRIGKVAIIDWDLHHGNGTQKIFYDTDRVLNCSIHHGNIFPYTGWIDEIGSGRGRGFTINAPIQAGSTIADYRLVFEDIFIPAIRRFRPDAILISAGQDPLWDDPKSSMRLVPEDFGTLTGLVRDATERSLALVLEGGYGPSHGSAISSIFASLAGKPVPLHEGKPAQATCDLVAMLHKMTG
jgi:acetoin utilization deacetylase AcuC-like enzyme